VDKLDFTVGRGEILGLIGPNGAGKTTVINMVSGTQRATAGRLLFEGEPIGALPTFRRAKIGIGRTFQIMQPFPELSVRDNVAVGALFGSHKMPHVRIAREEAQACIEFVGLADRADQRADALGGPDRKRLELAKALATKPKLLLLDEVMAGLNHVEIEVAIDLIRKIRASGVSILVIEHVMKAIKSLSDRLIVLHHGVKIAEGSPETVLNDDQVITAYLGRKR
jgi:branched-chain amino acid transport system ATP-binding protein